VCDFCIERNKLELSNLEFETVASQVKELISAKPMPLIDLVNAVKNSKEDKTIKVVQWLVDNEKIVCNKQNELAWKK
jgi:ATP-dependent DNA helicase RecQ